MGGSIVSSMSRSSGFEVPKTSIFGPRTLAHLTRPTSCAAFRRARYPSPSTPGIPAVQGYQNSFAATCKAGYSLDTCAGNGYIGSIEMLLYD